MSETWWDLILAVMIGILWIRSWWILPDRTPHPQEVEDGE